MVKMEKKFDEVYQFKITLKGSKPPIWRRIQVPSIYSFWDLHIAIQDCMGWLDYHLHQFDIKDPSSMRKVRIGIPDKEGFDPDILSGWKQKIAEYFSMENSSAGYIYDFGDSWEHNVKLEKIIPRDENINYPICIKGKRAGPPEDCGGLWGYENLFEILKDTGHEEYEETMAWLGKEFDPEYFDANEVHFDDPAKRFKIAFS